MLGRVYTCARARVSVCACACVCVCVCIRFRIQCSVSEKFVNEEKDGAFFSRVHLIQLEPHPASGSHLAVQRESCSLMPEGKWSTLG